MATFSEHLKTIKQWVRQVGPTRAARMAGLAVGTVKIAVSSKGNPTAETLEALDGARQLHAHMVEGSPHGR